MSSIESAKMSAAVPRGFSSAAAVPRGFSSAAAVSRGFSSAAAVSRGFYSPVLDDTGWGESYAAIVRELDLEALREEGRTMLHRADTIEPAEHDRVVNDDGERTSAE
jgi:hypothetical protein